MPYQHTATGTIHYPGQVVQGVQTHDRMSADAWAALGCVPYAPPGRPAPTLADLRAGALARYQSDAADVIRRNVPAPWDVLRDVATAEFREWADGYLAMVAGELARLEEAVAAAQTSEALAAIAADWPEVQ